MKTDFKIKVPTNKKVECRAIDIATNRLHTIDNRFIVRYEETELQRDKKYIKALKKRLKNK